VVLTDRCSRAGIAAYLVGAVAKRPNFAITAAQNEAVISMLARPHYDCAALCDHALRMLARFHASSGTSSTCCGMGGIDACVALKPPDSTAEAQPLPFESVGRF
jgi:hypothetical protein